VSRAAELRGRLVASEQELQTSLDGVAAAHRLLVSTTLTTEQAAYLHYAIHAATHLSYLVDTVIDGPHIRGTRSNELTTTPKH